MITLILVVVGCVVGGISAEVPGALFGAVVGYLLGHGLSLSKRIDDLESQLATLLRRTAEKKPDIARPVSVDVQTQLPAGSDDAPPIDVEREAPAMAKAAATQASTPRPAVVPPTATPAATSAAASEPAQARASAPQRQSAPSYPKFSASETAAFRWLQRWFTTGNLVVKIGGIILFIGVCFLLKYAAEHTRVPIELRLAGVCAGAIVLLGFGWRLRSRNQGYGLILQGVAIGILYLSVFAAMRLYSLVPAGAAFAILVALAAFSTMLAVMQNSLTLAMMAAAGGFLAPVLTSTGQGSHVMLFSYYAVLNGGILAIAWFKSWRALNLLGFVFTFGIATAWGALKYQPEHFATTEPFLILFFVFYVAIAVLFALRQAPRFTHYVDGSLIFGTPVVAFALQTALVRNTPFALAFSAVAVSAFYLLLGSFLYSRHRESLRLLVEAFLALGIAFGTLAVPLALDGRWTAATWALEGAAILWVGLRQNRLLARASGILLQFGAGAAFILHAGPAGHPIPLLNSAVLGGVLIAGAAFISALMLHLRREELREYEAPVPNVLFFWGLGWFVFAGLFEIDRLASQPDTGMLREFALHLNLLYLTFTAWLSSVAARRLDWPVAKIPALGLLLILVAFGFASLNEYAHPAAAGGWLAWPLAFVVWYWILRGHEDALVIPVRTAAHAVGLWLVLLLLSAQCSWALAELAGSVGVWALVAWAIVPAAGLIALSPLSRSPRWPIGSHVAAYLGVAAFGLALYLGAWSVFTNFSSRGDPSPLPYIPLLNPFDLAQAIALFAIAGLLL